jgi:hypothetical protein
LKTTLLFVFFISLCFVSCKRTEASPAALIEINQFASAYPQNNDTLGVQQFNDVWIFTNLENLGAYELPAKIPIKTVGDSIELFISPGFISQDNQDFRQKYSMVQAYIKKFKFEAGKVYNITPSVRYQPSYKVEYENFEGIGVKLDKLSSTDTIITISNLNSESLNNTKFGLLNLSPTKSQSGVRTTNKFKLPRKGTSDKAYLEFHYKSEVNVTIGLRDAAGNNYPMVEQFKSNTWKKVYLDLTQYSTLYDISDGYYVYFAIKNADGNNNAKLYLDEVRVIAQK